MRRMQTIQSNTLTHHIHLIFTQFCQSGTVGDMCQRYPDTLLPDQLQRFLEAFKLMRGIGFVISICRCKMREHSFDLNARQRRGLSRKFTRIANMYADPMHTGINSDMDPGFFIQFNSRFVKGI